MKYCVAEIYLKDGKQVLKFRAKDTYFYWTDNIKSKDVIWGTHEEAKRFCKLKSGRVLIPENCVNYFAHVTVL